MNYRGRPHVEPPIVIRSLVRALVALSLLATAVACHEEGGTKVVSLDIEGGKSIDAKTLKAVLATQPSSRLPWGTTHVFDRRTFQDDLKRVVAYYADHGYPDARVTSFDATLSDDQKSIALTIVVDEGEPLVVEDVRLWGFEPLPQEHLRTLQGELGIRAGVVYDRTGSQARRQMATRELQDHGFPYARVELLESPGTGPKRVVLTLAADPGPQAVVGAIEVSGNKSVSENVIRRTLAFSQGEQFRVSALQASQRRLYDLDLFEFANVEPRLTEVPAGTVPVRITVAERDHREFRFSVGYGTEEKARAEVGWKHLNFFGGARTADVEAKWSALDRGVRTRFTQPYVFSPSNSLEASGQRWFADEPAFLLDTRGGRIGFTRELSTPDAVTRRGGVTTVTGSLVYEFEKYSISNDALEDLSFRDELIALGLDPRTGAASGTLAAIAFDARRTTTTSLLDARQGYVANLHVERAARVLAGDFAYTEVTLEGRHYWTLGRRAVWANKLRMGAIAAPDPIGDHVPFFKRYFLGGSNSVRGWGRFELSPLSGSGLPIGGHSFLEASSELRLPLSGNVGAVAFLDAGQVWSEPWQFELGTLRYAVGPGLRYTTPIGPVRFDVGYQLNPIPDLLINGEPQKRRWRMHFSIGHAF